MSALKGKRQYFKGIKTIKFEGPESDNPLAFKYYNPKRKVGKKNDEGSFSLCYCLLAYLLRHRR